jgi:hypothetical protein
VVLLNQSFYDRQLPRPTSSADDADQFTWRPTKRHMYQNILRVVVSLLNNSSLAKYLLLSCSAAKSVTYIENSDHDGGIHRQSDLGSLPYRLLHFGVTRSGASVGDGDGSSREDDRDLYLQLLESLVRGTSHESWSPALRSILSHSILTHLNTHFIQFNNPIQRFSPKIFSSLLTILCSCLLSPEANSLSDSNEQHPSPGGGARRKVPASNHAHPLSTSTLTLPELIQWIDDRYLCGVSVSSTSLPSPVLLSALYSFLSRISFSGCAEKLYSHQNRKLYSLLFANERILSILMTCLESHLPQHSSLSKGGMGVSAVAAAAATTEQQRLDELGLITLWIVLYSSEGMRGKWKRLTIEDKKTDFDWKYFLTTFFLEPPECGGDGDEDHHDGRLSNKGDDAKGERRRSEREEKNPKRRELTVSDKAILAITSLLSESA